MRGLGSLQASLGRSSYPTPKRRKDSEEEGLNDAEKRARPLRRHVSFPKTEGKI